MVEPKERGLKTRYFKVVVDQGPSEGVWTYRLLHLSFVSSVSNWVPRPKCSR